MHWVLREKNSDRLLAPSPPHSHLRRLSIKNGFFLYRKPEEADTRGERTILPWKTKVDSRRTRNYEAERRLYVQVRSIEYR